MKECSEKGIVVFNTPGANANAVKEIVLAGLLMSSRGIYAGASFINEIDGVDSKDLKAYIESGKKSSKEESSKGADLRSYWHGGYRCTSSWHGSFP